MTLDPKDIVRNTYNKIAQKYLDARDMFHTTKHLEKLVPLVPRDGTVLDIGCGPGIPVDRYLIDNGYNVIGLDISESQIELAKKNVPKGMYEVKDITTLTMGEYAVDAVVSFYVIFHIPRETQQQLFEKMHSYLKVGGPILVTMATTDWEGIEEDFYGEKMYESHYSPEKNTQIIKAAGFEILRDEIDDSANEKHQIILAHKKY